MSLIEKLKDRGINLKNKSFIVSLNNARVNDSNKSKAKTNVLAKIKRFYYLHIYEKVSIFGNNNEYKNTLEKEIEAMPSKEEIEQEFYDKIDDKSAKITDSEKYLNYVNDLEKKTSQRIEDNNNKIEKYQDKISKLIEEEQKIDEIKNNAINGIDSKPEKNPRMSTDTNSLSIEDIKRQMISLQKQEQTNNSIEMMDQLESALEKLEAAQNPVKEDESKSVKDEEARQIINNVTEETKQAVNEIMTEEASNENKIEEPISEQPYVENKTVEPISEQSTFEPDLEIKSIINDAVNKTKEIYENRYKRLNDAMKAEYLNSVKLIVEKNNTLKNEKNEISKEREQYKKDLEQASDKINSQQAVIEQKDNEIKRLKEIEKNYLNLRLAMGEVLNQSNSMDTVSDTLEKKL